MRGNAVSAVAHLSGEGGIVTHRQKHLHPQAKRPEHNPLPRDLLRVNAECYIGGGEWRKPDRNPAHSTLHLTWLGQERPRAARRGGEWGARSGRRFRSGNTLPRITEPWMASS